MRYDTWVQKGSPSVFYGFFMYIVQVFLLRGYHKEILSMLNYSRYQFFCCCYSYILYDTNQIALNHWAIRLLVVYSEHLSTAFNNQSSYQSMYFSISFVVSFIHPSIIYWFFYFLGNLLIFKLNFSVIITFHRTLLPSDGLHYYMSQLF